MLTVLGSLLGFAGSAVPAVVDHYSEKANQEFQIKKLKAVSELQEKGHGFELDMHESKAGDEEHSRVIRHDIEISKGRGFIAALQKSVRPVITYSFFGLFLAVKLSLLRAAIQTGMPVDQALAVLWDENTQALFAAIISYWFGSRAIEKARGVK